MTPVGVMTDQFEVQKTNMPKLSRWVVVRQTMSGPVFEAWFLDKGLADEYATFRQVRSEPRESDSLFIRCNGHIHNGAEGQMFFCSPIEICRINVIKHIDDRLKTRRKARKTA